MKKPIEANFKLSKFKVGKGGGLETHFEVNESIGEAVFTEKHHLSSAKDVHPDLQNELNKLRSIVARVFGLTSFLSVVDTPEFKSTKNQDKIARDFEDEVLGKVDVRGISLSGEKENIGVVITAVLTVMKTQKTAINTPRIQFAKINFGFEEELEQILTTIEKEVYKFLFEDKRAQLSLFDPTADEDYVDGKAAAAGESKDEEE